MRAHLLRSGATTHVVAMGRLMMSTSVAVTLAAIGCGAGPGNAPVGGSDRLHDVPEQPSTPRDTPPAETNEPVVTITDDACILDGVRRIPGRYPTFEVVNETERTVAFDIGKLADGHTFAELRNDIQDAMEGPQSGDPVAERPNYFRGSITGDITYAHGGGAGPSLIQVGWLGGSTMTWSLHPTRYGRKDGRGTWAVICYRQSGRDESLNQIGVVGPLEVGSGLPSERMLEDSFVDLSTDEVTPLPDSITSITGAGNYSGSPDGGSLLFDTSGDRSAVSQIHVADLNSGRIRQLTNDAEGALEGSWSPDGKVIVYVARSSRSTDLAEDVALFLMDVTTRETTPLVNGRAGDLIDPHFTPNGRSVLFSRQSELWSIPVSGGTPRLEISIEGNGGARYSPDGAHIAFGKTGYWQYGHGGGSFGEIWLTNADGNHPRHLAGDKDHSLSEWTWSPDGTRIAAIDVYANNEVIIIEVPTKHLTQLGVSGWPVSWLDEDTVIVGRHHR